MVDYNNCDCSGMGNNIMARQEGKVMWSTLPFFRTTYPQIKDFINEEVDKGKSILPRQAPPMQLRPKGEWQGPTLFNAFIATPRDKVKVVILGQDPYPNKNHAMGLAFSVPASTYPLPPSLQNIFEELFDDLGNENVDASNGSLLEWAKQGVLLLNTSLTVEEGKPASHADIGWDQLAKEVLEAVSTDKSGVVFILWGSKAHTFESYIKDPKYHMIIKSAHPSPLSAHKGFFGSRPFSKANAFLEAVGQAPIKW
jgi:uracil-DNA glycosylase